MAETKIGGRTFRVGTVLATDAIKLQVRLLKIVGGGVERLPIILAGMKRTKTEMDENGNPVVKELPVDPEAKAKSDAAAVAALSDILSKADPEGVTQLLTNIVAMAQIQGDSKTWGTVDIDQDFTDHKKDLFKVVFFVLKEVLGDFFDGVPGAGDLGKALGRG